MLCRRCALSLVSRALPRLSIATQQRPLQTASHCHHRVSPFSTSAVYNRPNAHEQRPDFYISEEEDSTSTVVRKSRKDTSENADKPNLNSAKTTLNKTKSSSSSTPQFTDFYLPEEQGDPEPLPIPHKRRSLLPRPHTPHTTKTLDNLRSRRRRTYTKRIRSRRTRSPILPTRLHARRLFHPPPTPLRPPTARHLPPTHARTGRRVRPPLVGPPATRTLREQGEQTL